jgi:hypothetical protein
LDLSTRARNGHHSVRAFDALPLNATEHRRAFGPGSRSRAEKTRAPLSRTSDWNGSTLG